METVSVFWAFYKNVIPSEVEESRVLTLDITMEKEVGTYTVKDAFHLTSRGWVLVGTLTGAVNNGNHLAFPSGLVVRTKGIEMLNIRNQEERICLVISAPFTKRQRPVDRQILDEQIIGATARVLE
ncbi:hypothetical protein [Hymenobacter jeollabukensis]|uniref:Uncharacterized protein n=1 Tax=Hymenobacter jeollabukensis TaxID=2025313 RepID=A0A5R8WUK7_9BACT|nr:hypothetical protein [Hymenobacter jeollabukensis]TLM95084.1 hypothetical protein FDY95_04605 [Hymenobacter jeollabukensis]